MSKTKVISASLSTELQSVQVASSEPNPTTPLSTSATSSLANG
jgi:hypothetical protein